MSDHESQAAALRRVLDELLSQQVRPFLKSHGFIKSGRTFRRTRGPLYDMINFQGSYYNNVHPWSSFFVNVGVGSTEMDAVHLGQANDRTPTHEYVLNRRWESLVSSVPSEVCFDTDTDIDEFADMLIDSLDRMLPVLDAIDDTDSLVGYAVSHNLLHRMEKTCRYLVATRNTNLLGIYLNTLRNQFHNESRWELFNRQLINAIGPSALTFIEQGLLDSC